MELITTFVFSRELSKEEWFTVCESLNKVYPGIVWNSGTPLQVLHYSTMRILNIWYGRYGYRARWQGRTNLNSEELKNVQDGDVLLGNINLSDDLFGDLFNENKMTLQGIYGSLLVETVAREKLNKIVKDLLKKYVGGRPFFNALDAAIKNVVNEDIIIEVMRGLDNEWIATSGGFGDRLYNLWKSGKVRCRGMVVFNGKMCTKDKGVTCWYPADIDVDNKEFVFVDDSLFSGGTVKKVDDYLTEFHGSKIKNVSVVYDGSPNKNSLIKSLFRYYP